MHFSNIYLTCNRKDYFALQNWGRRGCSALVQSDCVWLKRNLHGGSEWGSAVQVCVQCSAWWCTMWLYCAVMQHMPGSHPCQAQETGSEVGQIQDKTASSQEKTQSWSSKSKASDFIRYSQVYKFCNILDSFKRFCELKCSTAFLSWDTWKFYSPNCNEYLYVYENRDMAIAMSSSRADTVLGLNIPSSCPGWGYLNI